MWSRFKSLWREVRPNARWDAIKAIFYLIAIATASTGAYASFIHYAKSVSLDFYIILGIFLCALIFAGLAYVTGRYAQKKPINEADTSAQQSQAALNNLTDEIQCRDQRLHNIADRDRREISRVVIVIKAYVQHQHNSEPSSYMDFLFTVFNGSVFSITLDFELGGYIRFREKELGGNIKKMSSEVRNSSHGDSGRFVLRLWLSQSESEYIYNSQYPDDVFSFDFITVNITGSTFHPEVQAERLKIPPIHKDGRFD